MKRIEQDARNAGLLAENERLTVELSRARFHRNLLAVFIGSVVIFSLLLSR